MYAGPKIIKDGLVFGYDTGANPSSNFDHKSEKRRFFKGRSTENVLDYTTEFNSWTPACNSGDSPTVTANVAPGPRGLASDPLADRIYIPDNGTYPRIYQVFTPTTTSTHKFSIWLRTESGTASTFFGVFRNSPWALPSFTTVSTINTTWQRFELTVNPLDTTSHQIYIGSHDSTKGQTFLMWGAQMEVGTVTSPYITGTRSSTESLINLTKSTTIDVANISFNSNGLPTFDGTDDEINTGITTQLVDFSCVVVFKDGGSATWGRIVDKSYTTGFFISSRFNSSGAYIGAGIVEPNPPHGQSLTYDSSKYNYFVVTRSGTTHTIYLNGSTNSASKTGSGATLSSTEMAIGAWYGNTNSQRFTGEIPVVKLYNRALTPKEIQQDFQAYKNRFNL